MRRQEAKPQLDAAYIPPVLSISAWPQLGRDIVRAIFDIVGRKVEVLSQQVVNRGIGLDSRDPGDLERILMLMLLNSAYSSLAVLAFAEGVHPFVAYTELCRLLGQLSIFDAARRPVEIPAYDHEDLHRIFSGVRIRVEQLIHSVRDYDYQQRYFVGAGMGMQVSLEPAVVQHQLEMVHRREQGRADAPPSVGSCYRRAIWTGSSAAAGKWICCSLVGCRVWS